MKINWLLRFMNKKFLVAFIPLVFLAIQLVLQLFNIEVDLTSIQETILELVQVVCVAAGLVAGIMDPTTPNYSDSENALSYIEPGVLPEDSMK